MNPATSSEKQFRGGSEITILVRYLFPVAKIYANLRSRSAQEPY